MVIKWCMMIYPWVYCILQQGGEALGQHLFLILTQLTYPIHPYKTKHTCELVAVVHVQAGELHVLEHLDVAWGNGVGGGRVRRNEEDSWKVSH